MARGERLDRLLTLQEAADRLKVHYMTAYRWVRRGDLPAVKTGGRLRVRTGDLERFLADREVDVALPGRAPGRTDWPGHVERLTGLLLAGRVVDCNAAVRRIVADGAPAGEVYVNLLTPALYRVGEEWAAGRVGVAEEHRATEIVAGLMARLAELFRRRGPARGSAVTLTPSGEQHGLGAAMVADFLRAAGYEVHHLGVSVPADDLLMFLDRVPADIVAVSVTCRDLDPRMLPALIGAVRSRDTPLALVGGQGADPDSATALGAVHVGSVRELNDMLEQRRVHATR